MKSYKLVSKGKFQEDGTYPYDKHTYNYRKYNCMYDVVMNIYLPNTEIIS